MPGCPTAEMAVLLRRLFKRGYNPVIAIQREGLAPRPVPACRTALMSSTCNCDGDFDRREKARAGARDHGTRRPGAHAPDARIRNECRRGCDAGPRRTKRARRPGV